MNLNEKGITIGDLLQLGVRPDIARFHKGDDIILTVSYSAGGEAERIVDEPDPDLDYYHWDYFRLSPDKTRLLHDLTSVELVRARLTYDFQSDGTADVLTVLDAWIGENAK